MAQSVGSVSGLGAGGSYACVRLHYNIKSRLVCHVGGGSAGGGYRDDFYAEATLFFGIFTTRIIVIAKPLEATLRVCIIDRFTQPMRLQGFVHDIQYG
ncbi:hypothetical protein Zmor_016771 [Zophobas morio]|uniref:Uncharacterized protein n=1 Tax=Zophobas morio TaxID=2755281 RepID=A0AA38I886_9CUCU|nr:hypothetical protein Zmor_016771 [Zophobas morio]